MNQRSEGKGNYLNLQKLESEIVYSGVRAKLATPAKICICSNQSALATTEGRSKATEARYAYDWHESSHTLRMPGRVSRSAINRWNTRAKE
ncbi:hypothetical protein C7B79_30600 [Chroococcidiopsis cubana CCALA 043]|nr:hypothetical protein C7B79_30600 [Chroococcidiopsis cubana CCALA 043]